ncbi:permease [Limisalsivibrio acetivorans]|uniref:permease n=1 Tax=Limisalsivibrio acetivorans TaxID=1304888 RepID=UPI0003B44496|nr:permease [Limisalsivibrio acetivorans]
MIELLTNIGKETLDIALETSVYMMLGLAAGGFIKSFFSPSTASKYLSGKGLAPVVRSSLIGIPLPLCSCGVAPTAASLRKQGAGKGPTASFLVSTPETSIDSIALTWVLMGPFMTIARPIAALFTAIAAGLVQRDDEQEAKVAPAENEAFEKTSFMGGQRYAFTDLWPELVPWFGAGLLLAGIISAVVPPSFMDTLFGGGVAGMLGIMVISMGLYICSSASTPIAAAMMAKGMSPGTALVFMLAGPATNLASLGIVAGILGKKGTALYLGAIAVCTFAAGIITDIIFFSFGFTTITAAAAEKSFEMPAYVSWTALLILIILALIPSLKKNDGSKCGYGDCECSQN